MPPRIGGSGLLVRLDVGQEDFGLGRHSADYLTDGTVIRWKTGTGCGIGQPCGTQERNTLTASGLTAVRAILAEDGDLLAVPKVVERQIAPGKHPLYYGDTIDTFVLERPDGTRYTVQVPSTTSRDASTWVEDPAITRLNALADAMLHPETLGAGSLADPAWTACQPTATALIVRLTAAIKPVPFDGPFGPDIEKTGWPFVGSPDTFGTAFVPSVFHDNYFIPEPGSTFRCAFLASDGTLEAITSLPEAGASLARGYLVAGGVWGSSGLRWGDDLDFSIRAVALLPEDIAGSCSDAFAY